eukprot:2385464-Pleurochrysis_carterae.AAC.1
MTSPSVVHHLVKQTPISRWCMPTKALSNSACRERTVQAVNTESTGLRGGGRAANGSGERARCAKRAVGARAHRREREGGDLRAGSGADERVLGRRERQVENVERHTRQRRVCRVCAAHTERGREVCRALLHSRSIFGKNTCT